LFEERIAAISGMALAVVQSLSPSCHTGVEGLSSGFEATSSSVSGPSCTLSIMIQYFICGGKENGVVSAEEWMKNI
jgi:hypothetical protein